MAAHLSSTSFEPVSDDFWAQYRAQLSRRRMTPKAARWHERRARHFVWNRDRSALEALTAEEVSGYFRRTQARGVLEEWQLVQIVDAVEILCRGLLGLPWAGDFDWRRWKQPHLASPAAPPEQVPRLGSGVPGRPEPGGPFADGPASREAFRQHPEALQRLRTELRARHYSLQTERAYGTWLARFLGFHRCASPESLEGPDVKAYLDYLATAREVSASTQNQALCALVFFYDKVLARPLGEFGDFARAKRPIRVPAVLSRDEVRRLEERLSGTYALMAGLLYGAGLRLMECVRLRVKDVDFDRRQILVRDGKGQKDRITVLPEKHRGPLYEDVSTTMIYTHVLNRPGLAVRSPADL